MLVLMTGVGEAVMAGVEGTVMMPGVQGGVARHCQGEGNEILRVYIRLQ